MYIYATMSDKIPILIQISFLIQLHKPTNSYTNDNTFYRTYPKHDSAQIVTVKINSFHKNIEEIRKWYNTQHMNYDLIKVEKSKWWVWNEALDIARNSVKTIQVGKITY